MAPNISKRVVDDMIAHGIDFVTSVPCKQLAGVIEYVENNDKIIHVPSNKEDEGMGLCAGAYPCRVRFLFRGPGGTRYRSRRQYISFHV